MIAQAAGAELREEALVPAGEGEGYQLQLVVGGIGMLVGRTWGIGGTRECVVAVWEEGRGGAVG